MNSGIYTITNIQDGKVYVGSSTNIKARWYKHRRDLNFNRHHSHKLQADWNKLGPDAFQFNVVLPVSDRNDLIKHEQFHINSCDAVKKGYNVFHKASGSPIRNRGKIDEAVLAQRKIDKRAYHKAYKQRKREAERIENAERKKIYDAERCNPAYIAKQAANEAAWIELGLQIHREAIEKIFGRIFG